MSNNTARSVTVHIMQREFTVACNAAEAPDIVAAAAYLDRQLRAVATGSHVPSPDRAAIMAGLNISHELLTLRKTTDAHARHHTRLQNLHQQVEQAVTAMQSTIK